MDGTLWAVEVFTATVKGRLECAERRAERYRALAVRAHEDTGECSGENCLVCRELAEADKAC